MEKQYLDYEGFEHTIERLRRKEMPEPGLDYVGQIVQYVGSTTSDYVKGYYYECVSDGKTPATYSWVQRPVQAQSEAARTRYNVLDYGLIANDQTSTVNNSDALSAMIDEIPEGAVIYFPQGTWRFTTPITITKSLAFVGDNDFDHVNTSSFYAHPQSELIFAGTSTDETFIEVDDANVSFEGLSLYASSGSTDAYRVSNNPDSFQDFPYPLLVENINRAGINGISVKDALSVKRLAVRNCTFRGFSGYALQITDFTFVRFCNFSSCAVGIQVSGSDDWIQNCSFVACGVCVQSVDNLRWSFCNLAISDTWADQIIKHVFTSKMSYDLESSPKVIPVHKLHFNNLWVDEVNLAAIYLPGHYITNSNISGRFSRVGMSYAEDESQSRIPVRDDTSQDGLDAIVAYTMSNNEFDIQIDKRSIGKGGNSNGVCPAYGISSLSSSNRNNKVRVYDAPKDTAVYFNNNFINLSIDGNDEDVIKSGYKQEYKYSPIMYLERSPIGYATPFRENLLCYDSITKTFYRSVGTANTDWEVILSKNDKRYNVLDYGLKGNKTTDNTSALRNLISVVPNGSVIFFPVGTYMISDGIEINKDVTFLGENQEMQSAGTASNRLHDPMSIIKYGGNTENVTMFTKASGYYDVNFVNLTLDGGNSYDVTDNWTGTFTTLPFYNQVEAENLEGINGLDMSILSPGIVKNCMFWGFSGYGVKVAQHKYVERCGFYKCKKGIVTTFSDSLLHDLWFCKNGTAIYMLPKENDYFASISLSDIWADQLIDHLVEADSSVTSAQIITDNVWIDSVGKSAFYLPEATISRAHIQGTFGRIGMDYAGIADADRTNALAQYTDFMACGHLTYSTLNLNISNVTIGKGSNANGECFSRLVTTYKPGNANDHNKIICNSFPVSKLYDPNTQPQYASFSSSEYKGTDGDIVFYGNNKFVNGFCTYNLSPVGRIKAIGKDFIVYDSVAKKLYRSTAADDNTAWEEVTTDTNGMYKVYSGTYDSVEGEFYDVDGNALPKVDKQQYYDIATRTTWIYYSAWSSFFRLFNDVVGMESSQMLSPLMTQYYPELNTAHFRCMNVSGNDGGLIEGFIYKLDRVSVTPEAGDSPVDEGWWEVDSTTGKMIQTTDTEVVSGKLYFDYVWTQVKTQQSVFHGTLDEWDELTPEEQAQYDFIATPDEAVEDIADSIIDGDMRAVTSNAVAQVVPSDASASNKLVSASTLNNRVREVFRIPYNMTITNFLERFVSIGIHVGEVFIEGNIGNTTVDSWCSYEANIVSVTNSYVGNIKLTDLSNGTEFLYKSYNTGSFNWVLASVSGPGIKTVQLPPTKILTVVVGSAHTSVFTSIQIQGMGSRMVLLEYNNTSLYGKILRDGTEYTTERGSSGFAIGTLTFANSSSRKFTITNLADTETETITVIGNVIGVEVN